MTQVDMYSIHWSLRMKLHNGRYSYEDVKSITSENPDNWVKIYLSIYLSKIKSKKFLW